MGMKKQHAYLFGEPLPARQAEAIDNIKSINRELLVAAGADIPDRAAAALDAARDFVLAALHHLLVAPDRCLPVEEMPVRYFKALIEQEQSQFAPLFEPVRSPCLPKSVPMPSKLNGQRKHRSIGCL
jgi:hypothetical protein